MKKAKKLTALLLAAMIMAGMFAAMPLTASAAEYIYDVRTENELKAALYGPNKSWYDSDKRTDDRIIYITANITHRDIVTLHNQKTQRHLTSGGAYAGSDYLPQNLTINLGGNTLTIDGMLLEGVNLTITGGGTLNIIGRGRTEIGTTGDGEVGLYVKGGQDEFLNNVGVLNKNYTKSTFRASGSIVNITYDNFTRKVQGVRAEYGSYVEITGNVNVSGNSPHGVYADNDSQIIVSRSVTANGTRARAAYSDNGSYVTVGDNATANGTDSYAAIAKSRGSITFVSEDATASGSGSRGASAEGGTIFVGGNIKGDAGDIFADETRIGSPLRSGVVIRDSRFNSSTWNEYKTSSGSSIVYKRASGVGDGWQQSGRDWYYYSGGDTVKDKWVQSGNAWYWLGPDGIMVSNTTKEIDRVKYYFHSSGAMATGWAYHDRSWYFYQPSGAQAKGWVLDGGKWYFLNNDGRMATGWITQGGVRYYLTPGNGDMKTGWVLDGSTWYYLQPSGAMATGWVLDGGTWYYLKATGAMAANENLNLGGKVYNFAASGACTNP